MNEVNDAAVPPEEPTIVAPPEAVLVEKKKRGRPRKPEGAVTVPKKAKRDVFAEAFGDKRARVGILAIKDKAERKSIIAAVKAFSNSEKKRADLETKVKALQAKSEKLALKIGEKVDELNQMASAKALVEAYKPRVASVIDTIYGNIAKTVSLPPQSPQPVI